METLEKHINNEMLLLVEKIIGCLKCARPGRGKLELTIFSHLKKKVFPSDFITIQSHLLADNLISLGTGF